MLVTGATGHVGVNLVRALLQEGRRVRVLMHEDRGGCLDGLDVERAQGDVLDPASLRRAVDGVEVVYHLAALISVLRRQDELVHRVNSIGPRNVVEACLDARVKRLVHFSSIHAFSAFPTTGVIDETRAPTGSEPGVPAYDRSKAAGEREIEAGITRGLDAVIVNPTSVLGPHDYRPSRMGATLLSLERREFPALVEGGFNFVDVRDVVSGALAAEQKGQTGHRYLLSGRWASLREIAEIVEKVSGARAPLFTFPMWAAALVAPLAEAFADARSEEARFTPASLHIVCHHRWITSRKAEAELGYRARPLHETIADTLAWLREAKPAKGRSSTHG